MRNLLILVPLLAPQDPNDALYAELARVDRVTPVVKIVHVAKPAVVFIETEYTRRVTTFWGTRDRTYSGSGSGVVIHSDGYIVTNYHVVKGAKTLTVSFDGDPQRYPAELVSFVQSEDLALLKVDSPEAVAGGSRRGLTPFSETAAFPTVRMGTSADLMEGENVVAIGNPYGQAHTVSTGIVSGLHRDVAIPEHGLQFRDLIQTDASINFGNSGGPLLNVRGELIGINTAMNSQAENIGFAIPVDRVQEVLTDILFPQARKSWLGFDVGPDDTLEVTRVWADSPAALAGVCEGDRIVAIGTQGVESQEDFLHASLELEPQDQVAVVLAREGGRRETVRIDSWDRLDGVLFERLGMTVKERTYSNGQWILVDKVSQGSPADELGLHEGDLIPAIQPRVGNLSRPLRIRDRATLAQVVSSLDPGVVVEIDVYRDENADREYSRSELLKGELKLR